MSSTDRTVILRAYGPLGVALAREFAREGADVIMADSDNDRLHTATRALEAGGINVTAVGLDPHEPEGAEALIARVEAEGSEVMIWVNALESQPGGSAETLAPSVWHRTLTVTLSGTFFCCQAAGRHMLKHGRGVIINMVSVDAYKAVEGRAAYAAANAGIVSLTRSLGVEWASRGVRVVGMAVGDIASDDAHTSGSIMSLLPLSERRTPLRRFATAEEIAACAGFLASEAASFITAETVRVDGGWVAYQLF